MPLRPSADPRPPGSHASRQGSERGCGAGGRRAGQGVASASSTRAPPARPPPPLTRVSCRAAAASRQVKWTALHKAAGKGHAPWFKPLLKAWLKALFRPWLKALALALADASLRTWVSDRATGQAVVYVDSLERNWPSRNWPSREYTTGRLESIQVGRRLSRDN